ncbi:hypothetical protein [Actinomyces succiniciruminis]|uniref:Uncharacterized protein n=1 Tax=Actinomyces succiniciruminis TaxID=1522002 RepID=A0A1L7RBN0_9ACTO|nr:hypothetical protein [Actinomyces succiniciruminis]CED91291.1 Hypothetical protein AAM4_1459 [Actinomyces succiniciruminis]
MTDWLKDHPVKAAGLVVAGLVVVLVAGLALGASTDRLPDPSSVGGTTSATAVPAPASAAPTVSAAPGNSANVTSSTGVDFGAGLPRLGDSPFAETSDPEVFAASVQAAAGYDYSSYQPDDALAEKQRITDEWLAGMTGEDGPMGAEVHRVMRQSVSDSLDPDELSYRIAAREVDTIDVLAVEATDNSTLRAAGGNQVYLDVIGNRDTLYALTTLAKVTTTVEAVRDVAGWTRTQTTATVMIVRCDGMCELVGVLGSEAQ